jgi:hypothetical protein
VESSTHLNFLARDKNDSLQEKNEDKIEEKINESNGESISNYLLEFQIMT